MDEIFNFAQQQMNNYSARFGNLTPMQQQSVNDCSMMCGGRCSHNCTMGCDASCHGGCSRNCKHACDAFGGLGATQRRGW